MDRRTFLGAGALLLAACGEAAVNSGDYVEVRFVNSTGLSNVVVTVRGDDTSVTWTFSEPDDPPGVVGTGIQTAGQPVQFHVEAGEEITDHTCHVHADAIDNPSNVPTAVIYSQPLRVVCQSGWQEEEAA
jgi:hypothetical protein